MRRLDPHSGIRYTYLRWTASDTLTAYHDWTGTSTNCTVSDTSTLVSVTGCARTINASGDRELQFTVVGVNQNATLDVRYALADAIGNRNPATDYTTTGKNLIFDATPPTGVIASPSSRTTVSGAVTIT